jgi:virulence-associated protein VagC
MSMQTIRLENHDRVLVDAVEIQAHGEPDAVIYLERVFVRLPMQIKEPPTKNSPEIYVEASTMTIEPAIKPAPAFDKVTETKAAPDPAGKFDQVTESKTEKTRFPKW